eukprot:scaffold44082_cov69-Phaeocystis_antarctica.AAC.2
MPPHVSRRARLLPCPPPLLRCRRHLRGLHRAAPHTRGAAAHAGSGVAAGRCARARRAQVPVLPGHCLLPTVLTPHDSLTATPYYSTTSYLECYLPLLPGQLHDGPLSSLMALLASGRMCVSHPGAQVLRVDRWLHPSVVLHLPADVNLQAGAVRRVGPLDRPPQVRLDTVPVGLASAAAP